MENPKFKSVLNYIGSKYSLLNFLDFVIFKELGSNFKEGMSFADLFAGTGIVGTYFKTKNFKIISNDIQYYSYVINNKFLLVNKYLEFNGLKQDIPKLKYLKGKERILALISSLNSQLPKTKGFIYNNYSLGGTKNSEFERLYFTDENALIIDTIRSLIESWFNERKINEQEYFYLLGTLIEASDKVANTASVYGAFLKNYKKSALKQLTLEYNEIYPSKLNHQVYNENILDIVKDKNFDVVYLDPPYNSRQYCSNYHLLETIAKYDSPIISGKTGLRDYHLQKSNFCSKSFAYKEFENLISNLNAKYIFLSYNSDGLLDQNQIFNILSKKGKIKLYTLSYRRFKADNKSTRNYNENLLEEYLYVVDTSKFNILEELEKVSLTLEDLKNG